MPLRLALALILLAALCAPALAAPSADAPELNPEEEAAILNSVPRSMTAPVRVISGRLSVEARGMRFGRLLEEVGRQAGFETLVSPEVGEKKLSTSFRDMELIKGIQRLLSLISQRNYFIHYGPDDSITRIEVYDSAQMAPAKEKVRTPTTRATNQGVKQVPRRTLPRGRTITRPAPRTSTTRQPVLQKPTVTRRVPKPKPEGFTDDAPEVPFLVPSQEPQYIPPYKRNDRDRTEEETN